MKRIVSLIVLFSLIVVSAAVTQTGTNTNPNCIQQPSSNGTPVGTNTCPPIGQPGPTYYIAVAGSDSNSGLSPSAAWQTLGKLNAHTFALNSTILLNGGDTFGGGNTGLTLTRGPITVSSYGSGQATISTGNNAACITATNLPGVTISNIVCTGGGNVSNTTAGISIVNSQAGNTKLAGPTISGVTVSGYGSNGIEVLGTLGASGFNGTSITNNTVHDVTGNNASLTGLNQSACITVQGANYGSGATAPNNVNGTITGNIVYNCTGTALATNATGDGITVFESAFFTVSRNVAHDFGINNGFCGGPAGIWTADADNITIIFNEAYNGKTNAGAGGCDGNGFDMDGGVTNSVIAYNYAHDNVGHGILNFNYSDGTCCALWGNNVTKFNITQNNGLAEFELGFKANASGPAYIFNNTFVGASDSVGVVVQHDFAGNVTATFANNIIVGNSLNLISVYPHGTKTFAGNDYYSYGQAATFAWNGTSYSNASVATAFAAWQTATGQEKISGSNVGLTSNPQIYVPGGGWINSGYVPANLYAYELQSGSPMIGGGVGLGQFGINPAGTDYFGAAVTSNSQTVGAAQGDFGSFVASCTQSSTFLALTTSFSKLDDVNYNSWICGSQSDGDLTLMDVAYLTAAPNHAAMLLDVSGNGHNLTEHGAVTFIARTGIASDGTTGYEDTGWNFKNGPNLTVNSVVAGGYDTTAPHTTATHFPPIISGQNAAGTAEIEQSINTFSGGAGHIYCDANDEDGSSHTNGTAGFLLTVRTGANVQFCWLNNGIFGQANPASVILTDSNAFVLAEANFGGSGVTGGWNTDNISMALAGGGGMNLTNVSRRANSFMQAYGINVY